MKNIELPIIIKGKAIWETGEKYVLSYVNNKQVSIPKVTLSNIEAIESNRYELNDVNVQEIISAFSKVGKFWRQAVNSPLYNAAVENMCNLHGYDSKMAIRELNLMGSACSQIAGMYDLLELELGNRFYLEEWIAHGDALVHAQPIGNVLNIVAGNVPVSSVMSLLRCCLTKNQAITKISKRDPITLIYFVLALIELLPDHILTQNISVLYWPVGDDIEEKMYNCADAICAWGGEKSMNSIRKKITKQTRLLELGPKISFAVIGNESIDSKEVALDLAHDISLYNQQACFSPQMVFVEGNEEVFVDNLKVALELYADLLPSGEVSTDIHTDIMRTKMVAMAKGNKVISGDDNTWSIIVINDIEEIYAHPLNRVIYVMKVNNIRDCINFVDEKTQTLSISPWERNIEIREAATLKGASKITEIGLIECIRNGATHDNMFPMHELVRWVCVERGKDYWGKFVEDGPLDTTKWLMQNKKQLENVKY